MVNTVKYPGTIKKDKFPTPIRQLVNATDRLFGDDPLDEISNQFCEDDEEFERSEKLLRSIQQSYYAMHPGKISPKEIHLKPYLRHTREKDSFFLIRLWRNSTIRLVLWRGVLFNAIAVGWFLLFTFHPPALTILPNIDSMFQILIFLMAIIFGLYIDRVLDRANSPKLSYLNLLKVNLNLASAVTSMVRAYSNRTDGELINISHHDRQWTPLDSLIHLQYLLHSMPYTIIYEVRDKLTYGKLPLYKMQVDILNKENMMGHVANVDVVFDQIRQTLLSMESQGILIKAQDSKALLPLVDEMAKSLTQLQETAANSIPTKYTNILNQSVFLFMSLVPPLIYDPDKWGWGLFFYNVLYYIMYGFFRQAQEIKNPLEDKSSLKSAHTPIENWADINCARTDQIFEAAIALLLEHNPDMPTHFELNPNGSTKVVEHKKKHVNMPKSQIENMPEEKQTEQVIDMSKIHNSQVVY